MKLIHLPNDNYIFVIKQYISLQGEGSNAVKGRRSTGLCNSDFMS